MTPREYERIRSTARRFVVVAGHEAEAVETVVETGEGYVVVEKRDQAGRLAEASDPRG